MLACSARLAPGVAIAVTLVMHVLLPVCPARAQVDPMLVNWMKANTSPFTGLPYSYDIEPGEEGAVYSEMGESDCVPGVIERVTVNEGMVVYDGALWKIVLTFLGGSENLGLAEAALTHFWNGGLGNLHTIRTGYPGQTFIYDPVQPALVSPSVSQEGKRGFVFNIISADGNYDTADPLDGKTVMEGFPTWPTVHWEVWKPIAGENAWLTMAALQLYHSKYFNPVSGGYDDGGDTMALDLAEELARCALILQAGSGGIRMAPSGTYFSERTGPAASCLPAMADPYHSLQFYYNQISTENCLSWFAAFRMLHAITGKPQYSRAMQKLNAYFQDVFNEDEVYFEQGMRYAGGQWLPATNHFAVDVQCWGIAVLGPQQIDTWFGQDTAMEIWRTAKEKSGRVDGGGDLLGVGFTEEDDQLSVEWSGGAILATRILASYYAGSRPSLATEAGADAAAMRTGIELFKTTLPDSQAAYSYSEKRKWIPFGWYAHDRRVLSMASACWVALVDMDKNPFELPDPVSPPSIVPPEPPVLNAAIAGSNQVTLGWGLSDYAERYAVHYGTSPGVYTGAVDVGWTLRYTVDHLEEGVDYYFAVSAQNDEGNSAPSNEKAATTEALTSLVLNDTAAERSGPWTLDTLQGINSFSDDRTYKPEAYGAGSVRWRSMIPEAGYYKIYYWLPSAHPGYSSNQVFAVHHAEGTAVYQLNAQQHAGGEWQLFGTHWFEVGSAGFVGLNDLAADGYVVADAIRFEPVTTSSTGLVLSGSAIAENEPLQTLVGTLDVTNAGAGRTFAYAFVEGPGGRDNGAFALNGNRLEAADSFNYEQEHIYSIRIRATDQFGASHEEGFLVSIENTVEPAPAVAIPAIHPGGMVELQWDSLPNHVYTLYQSTYPTGGFAVVQDDIPATPPVNTFTDTVLNLEQRYWKVSTGP